MSMPPAMILCGGLGTRLRDVTELLPKPMVPIGMHPIVWHIMKTYAAFGVNRFILCLGWKREVFIDYFLAYRSRAADLTITLGGDGGVTYHGEHGEQDWRITLADTGDKTMTGGRIARAAKYLDPGDDELFLTYGDGVSNVDIAALLAHHRAQRKALTVTAVHPAGRYGEMTVDGGEVRGFCEKPENETGLINGGYMVMSRAFIARYLSADAGLHLEREPMRAAVADQQMAAFVHRGFWQCMDTPREHALLNDLWEKRSAPWTEHW